MTGCSKQCMEPRRKSGLLRRFAPRNDGGWSGATCLDIVAVGIDQERGVIGWAVIGARAGAAIVAAAGFQAFGMEFVDCGMILGAEGDMGSGAGLAVMQMQPERRGPLGAKACAGIVARTQHITERGEGGGIEAHAGVEIADA